MFVQVFLLKPKSSNLLKPLADVVYCKIEIWKEDRTMKAVSIHNIKFQTRTFLVKIRFHLERIKSIHLKFAYYITC